MADPTAEEISIYQDATGCSTDRARETLERMKPLLRSRVLLATQKPKRLLGLRDPIEDDPHIHALVVEAGAEAGEFATELGRTGIGSCHFIWSEQARILEEEHDIVWFSPSQMNPRMRFD